MVTEKMAPREIEGFSYLGRKKYTCGGKTHHVAEYCHDKTGMPFVLIPGGNFLMGKYTVTQMIWKKVMGTEPWMEKGHNRVTPGSPAVYISWEDTQEFCQKTGLSLPTEAQWEYACRAGTETRYYWGDDPQDCTTYTWCRKNTVRKGDIFPHDVGMKLPNAFGLYDTLGNVWELTITPYDGEKGKRIVKGGSYYASFSSSEKRASSDGGPSDIEGFRPIFPLDKGEEEKK